MSKYFCSRCGVSLKRLSDLSIIDTDIPCTRYSRNHVILFLCPVCRLDFSSFYQFSYKNSEVKNG